MAVPNIWTPRAADDERTAGNPARLAERLLGPALGTAQLVLAALFVAVGVAKLLGAPAMFAAFGTIENVTGLGAWLRILTGVLEVAGGVLLCVRAVAGVGAVLLGVVMAGAVLAHLFVLHTAPAAPLGLGAALALVAYAHRATLARVAAVLERNL